MSTEPNIYQTAAGATGPSVADPSVTGSPVVGATDTTGVTGATDTTAVAGATDMSGATAAPAIAGATDVVVSGATDSSVASGVTGVTDTSVPAAGQTADSSAVAGATADTSVQAGATDASSPAGATAAPDVSGSTGATAVAGATGVTGDFLTASSDELAKAAAIEAANGVSVTNALLHGFQQITVPKTAGTPAMPITGGSFKSSDPSVATVDQDGLVSRVSGTTGSEVTILFEGFITDMYQEVVPVVGEITYTIVHTAPIAIALTSTEVIG